MTMGFKAVVSQLKIGFWTGDEAQRQCFQSMSLAICERQKINDRHVMSLVVMQH